jgi:predicted acyl esterase
MRVVIAVLLLAIAIVHANIIDKVVDKAKDELEKLWDKKTHKIEKKMIPMSDGTKLHTVIVQPHGFREEGKTYPTVMDRSPYGKL